MKKLLGSMCAPHWSSANVLTVLVISLFANTTWLALVIGLVLAAVTTVCVELQTERLWRVVERDAWKKYFDDGYWAGVERGRRETS